MNKTVVQIILLACLLAPCIVLGSAPAGGAAAGDTLDLDALLQRLERNMASISTLQASFRQEKELAIFSQKVTLKGMVHFQKPSLFAWRVVEPLRCSIVISGDVLRQWDEETNRVQEISIGKNAAFQATIRQMKEWLSGTFTSLQKEYTASVESRSPIVLQFVPLETSAARHVINRVTIFFQEDERYISQIQMEEKNGDRMSLSFSGIRLNDAIESSVWEVRSHVR